MIMEEISFNSNKQFDWNFNPRNVIPINPMKPIFILSKQGAFSDDLLT